MRVFTCVAAAAAFLVSGAVLASPNFNYVELDYVDLDIDPLSGDGWAIGGSGLVNPNIYLLGRYSDTEADDNIGGIDVELELEQLSLGVGIQSPLQSNDNISLFGQLTYENIEGDFEVSGPGGFIAGDADDSRFVIEGGGRFGVLPQIELSASLRYIEVADFYDGEFGFKVGAEWQAMPWLALSIDYDQTEAEFDDVQQFQAGVRIYWDQLQ